MGPRDETVRDVRASLESSLHLGLGDEPVARALMETWPDIIEDTNHDMAEFNQAILLAVKQRFGSKTMGYVLARAEEILNERRP